ncbi:MAG: cell division protein ZapA [Burkholderiales bacterium]|nr:cell division protein ZapA [Burkholderiales bacterium]
MTTLEARIHGRTFRLGAPEGERDALAEAIAIVEAECAVIAQKQPTVEIERVLLLAALELAANKRDEARAADPRIESRLLALTAQIQRALPAAG